MSTASCQDHLPAGLTIEQELHGADVFGRVFLVRDQRFDSKSALKRIARCFEAEDEDAAWQTPLVERIERLLNFRLPHITTPLEAATDGGGVTYLLSDCHQHPLAARLQSDMGVASAEGAVIVEQILLGLAGLHGRGIAHGDVRPKNIYLDGNIGGDPPLTTWLADAAIGGMTYWSAGKLRDPDAAYYAPPEWKGSTQEPSFKADLYALGLSICEMLLGWRGNPARESDSSSPPDAWPVLAPKLRRRGVQRPLLKLIQVLLANESQRPADASQALVQYRNVQAAEHARRWRVATLALTLAALVILCVTNGWLFIAASREEKNLLHDVTAAKKEADTLKSDLDRMKEENGRLEADKEHLQKHNDQLDAAEKRVTGRVGVLEDLLRRHRIPIPPRNGEPDHDETAKKLWPKLVERGGGMNATLEGVADACASIQETKVKVLCEEGWLKELKPLMLDAKSWIDDNDFAQKYEKALREPWVLEAIKDAKKRLADLKNAQKEWDRWVDLNLLPANVQQRLEGCDSPVRDILAKWRKELLERKKWTIRMIEGNAPGGSGTERLLTVAGQPGKLHSWTVEKQHKYTRQEPRDLEFKWDAETPTEIGLVLEREKDWTFARPNLIDNSYSGPFAICQLHRAGLAGLKDKNTNVVLKFEILDCPGPPPGAYRKKDVATLIPEGQGANP